MIVTEKKTVLVLALTLGMIVGGSGAFSSRLRATAPDPKKADRVNIQGTWIAVSAEVGGEAMPAEAIKDFTVVISADKVRFNPKKDDRSATYKLDPTRTPKVIELTPLEGPAKGKPQRAIYELTGDRLKLCVQNGKGDPPMKFETKPGTDLRLLVLKRVKE